MKKNEAASMSLSGQSTSGENQKSSDSNVRDAPREVPSLDYWLKLAQEELEIGQSLNIGGIHTAVCIDISDSMKLGDAWKQSKEFFTQFIQGLTENQEIADDEYVALSVFGRDVRVVQRLTNKYSHLQRAFDSLKIGGPSPLYGGLLMALAAVTSVTVGSVNDVTITSRIILVTDGHPTNPLLITGSDDFDPDKKIKNQATTLHAANIISSKRVRIDCVPVGDADVPFLDVIASRTQGKVYSYKDGKMLGRRTATCVHWPDKRKNIYRFGASGQFDLEICPFVSRTADSATTPRQSSVPQPGPKSEDESFSDPLSSKTSQKGKDKIEEIYTRIAVKTTTQQSPTHRGLTSPTSTNMIPTTTTDTAIPATIMMTSGNLDLSESMSRVSYTSNWDILAELEFVEAQMINTPGIHTVICIDTSESMKEGSAWKETQQFFDEFIEEIEMITKVTDIKDEQIALSVFGQEVKVVQRLCKNYRQLREAFRILKIGGPTPMYGGLQMALAGFATPGKVGILNREYTGLRIGLAGITIPVINGIRTPSRIIIITDGLPTNTLISSGPDVRVSTEEAKSDIMKAVRNISESKISIYIVPVGDADESFLSLIASKADGQIVPYTDGRKLARRTINNMYAGIVLQQWKKDNEIARSFDTEMSLEDVMDVPLHSQIASLSAENKVEVLFAAKQAIEKGLLDDDTLEKYHYESEDKKVDLPPLGTRVRRVTNSDRLIHGDDDLGTIVGQHNIKKRTPDESQTEDSTTASPHTSTPLKQYVFSSFMMPDLQTLLKKRAKIDRNTTRTFTELDDQDVKLNSLGTRVRRGPDWDRDQQDEDGPGTIISHHANKRQVLVEWDNNGTCDFYRFDEKDMQDVMVVNEPRVLQLNERIATGCRVRRGKDWKWGNQDGTPGAEGVVIQVKDDDWVWVRWPHKERNIYRFGFEGYFDLEVCSPDEKYTVGLKTQPEHFLNMQMHEANMTPSQVPTAVITSEMDNNGSASTVSLMNTSTMQPQTFINTRMANNDTSSSPTEAMTTTGCTIITKPPAHETQTSAITTTSSVNYNPTTGSTVRFDMTRSIICRQESELGRGCYGTIVDSTTMYSELLTEKQSGRTSSSPHAGPEHVEESVVVPTLNEADDQNDLSIKMISETADELADLMKSGKISKVAEVFLSKEFKIEVIGKLLETSKCSRNDVQNMLTSCVEMLMTEMQKKVKSVWVGFRQRYPNVPIFVLISDNNGVTLSEKDIPRSFRSFEFVFRHEFEVSEEAREITKNEEIQKTEMGERNQRGLKNTLSRNIDQLLMCHSNIEMVGVSTVRSVQYGHKNAIHIPGYCIVVYVHVKGIIPYGEKEFPSHIEDFPVDVREGKFVQYSNVLGAREYHQCMSMGCQIVRCGGSSGTLGGFLDLEGGGIGILTCAHVALTEEERYTYLDSSPDEQLRLHTYFPWKTPRMGQPDEYHTFGTVLKFALKRGSSSEVGIDAAVVTITESHRKPVSGAFPKNQNSASGFTEDNPMVFPSGHCTTIEDTMEGCEVVKFGATTDITRGLIAHNCLYHKRSDVKNLAFQDDMYNQIEITPLQGFHGFSQKGDSGAIVFMANRGNRNELAAVGMVVGGTTSNTTVVTPILDILKALGLKNLRFKTFDPCPPPRQLLSLEDLKKGQEEQSKQIKEIKEDIAKTHKMIERLFEIIQTRR